MSRYVLLLILNTPFIVIGLINALVAFKISKISRKRFLFQAVFWLLIFAALASSQPIYNFLFSNNLTKTEPLSLFDVIQITGIVAVFSMANRSRIRVHALERRIQDLHQELSIRLAEKPTSDRTKK